MFSIITVTFNSSKTIYSCINSVQKQTFKDYEHIIIDKNSSDLTLKIIEELKTSKIKVYSENDKGIYDAMNKGILKVKTNKKFIIFLNSDDIFYNKNYLSNLASIINQNKNIKIFYGDVIYSKKNNLNSHIRYWKSSSFTAGKFGKSWCPPHPSFVVEKNVYKKYGLFNLKFGNSSDYELMFRLLEVKKIKSIYTGLISTVMRYGGKSNKNLFEIYNQNKMIIKVHQHYGIEYNYLKFYFFKLLNRLSQFIYARMEDE